jgi:hypothetical protein
MSRNLFGRLFGIPRDGSVERRRMKQLRAEQQLIGETAPSELSNAEMSVLLSVNDTLVTDDIRRARKLLDAQLRLIGTAHRGVQARQRLQTALADARWVNHDAAPTRDGDAAADDTFRESFDPHRPLIAERTLLIIELIFVVVEFFFWYQVFSEDVSRSAPWWDPTRVGAVLLAVLLPMSGIIAARVIGALAHRWVSGYRRIGRREKLGTVFSLLLAGAAIFAIYRLVHDRFDETHRAIGTTQLPASAMALVFVVVLVGDMMARVFLLSEIRKQTVRWTRRLNRLTDKATTANKEHADAWVRLRGETSEQLDRCERIVGTGARIITDSRAAFERAPRQTGLGEARPAHHGTFDDVVGSGTMAVPNPAQLSMFDAGPLALGPLRCVSDAIDTLRRWPPLDQEKLVETLEPMVVRLYRLDPEDRLDSEEKPEPTEKTGPAEPATAKLTNGAVITQKLPSEAL